MEMLFKTAECYVNNHNHLSFHYYIAKSYSKN